MSDLFFSTMKRLEPVLFQGDLETCEREVAREMQKLPPTPFHLVLELSITNDPADAARHFDRFLDLESKRFQIGAVYTEMNGFDINPDRWYCDLFAYPADGGRDAHDWLCDWESNRFDDYTIRGLERLQGVYASSAFRAKENVSASYMCSLMVVVKFQMFMQRSAAQMKLLQYPLYVTAHDYDFIAVFDPRPESSRTPVRSLSAEELTTDLTSKLHDEHPRTRLRAAMKLYSVGPAAKPAIAALIGRLADPNVLIRQAAALAMGQIDPSSDEVVSALVTGLERDQSANVRREIVRALGNSPTKKATNALAAALFDSDPGVRHYSAISLKMLGRDAAGAAPALRKLIETETDAEIRSQASVALERMGDLGTSREEE